MLVVLLLLAFLGNLRGALVVALILPLSALATFILMRLFGLSANLMSLGGLAIAIGMLVDAAVVVVENIENQLADAPENLPTLHLIYRAARGSPRRSPRHCDHRHRLPALLTLRGLEEDVRTGGADHCLRTIDFTDPGTDRGAGPRLLADPARGSHEPWLVRQLSALYARVLTAALADSRRFVVGALLALAGAGGAFSCSARVSCRRWTRAT